MSHRWTGVYNKGFGELNFLILSLPLERFEYAIPCNRRPQPRNLPCRKQHSRKRITAEGAAKAGVKLVLALGGRAQHCTIYVAETDDINKLYDFLNPALSWAKCDIMPVRENKD